MEKQTQFLFFFLLFFCTSMLTGSHHLNIFFHVLFHQVPAVKGQHAHYGSVKLFVFGDSYVDTGNLGKFSESWKEPYGLSFPGKPSGRFSDGRILTDYIASYFGIKSPVPFERRNITRKPGLEYGMNFAYGGTGVFKTLVDQPNMTIQIDHFQEILDKNVYTKQDLNKSVALVSVAGNDYTTFIAKNGSLQYMPDFTKKLVKQLAMDLKRIKGLGVENVLVTAVEPLGCYPALTATNSYQKCIEIFNSAAQFHNLQLKDAVNKLNTETNIHNSTASSFIFLNVYGSFMSALNKKHFKGKLEVKNPLEPCCVGLDDKYSCGSVDDKGVKKYSVCENPELSFFWDNVHPTQSGWHAVSSSLNSSLHRIDKSF